jgi:cytochrome d ubiquinol oxidase subunit II
MLRLEYTGCFFDLLNPFGLLCGVLSLALYGATWLQQTPSGLPGPST